jgi:hypothetical protein
MNNTMAKKQKPAEPAAAADDAETWTIYAKIDPALRTAFQEYAESREYPPALARVLERALRDFFKREGFPKPK